MPIRIRLPVSLQSYEKKTYKGWVDLHNGAHPLDPANESLFIVSLVSELNNKFPLDSTPHPARSGTAPTALTAGPIRLAHMW